MYNKNTKNLNPIDKKRFIRENEHMMKPPRMEGSTKNTGGRSNKKQKKSSN